MKSTARIATPRASRYLQQLCKHFAHKIETSFDAHEGICHFPGSTAALAARDDALLVTITAGDRENLDRGQAVIWNHLVRFAFREDLDTPDWQTTAEA